MGNAKVESRQLVIKAGMKPSDVINSDKATSLQKKFAAIFDADGKEGYSQREADVFNSTTITDNGKDGISLWTRYSDGSVKETKYNGDIEAFKFAPQKEVKPFVKQVKINKSKDEQEQKLNEYQPKAPYYKPYGNRTSIVDCDTLEFTTVDDSIEYMKKAPSFSLAYRVQVRDGELAKRTAVRDVELKYRTNARDNELHKRTELRKLNDRDPLISESYDRERKLCAESYDRERQKTQASYENEKRLTVNAYNKENEAQQQHCKYVNYRRPYKAVYH